MQIRLIYHDKARDLVGKSGDMLHVDESANGSSLLSRLATAHPQLISHLNAVRILRNAHDVTADTQLCDGDIVDVTIQHVTA
jgi:hypothetical protein